MQSRLHFERAGLRVYFFSAFVGIGLFLQPHFQTLANPCPALFSLLAADPRPQPSVTDVGRIPSLFQEIEGSVTHRNYQVKWKLVIESGQTFIDYAYESAEGTASVRLKVVGNENRLELDLPRNQENALEDLNLLQAVLRSISQKAMGGTQFSIVINDPTVIDGLNEVVWDYLKATHEFEQGPRRAEFSADMASVEEALLWEPLRDVVLLDTTPQETAEALLSNVNSSLQQALRERLVRSGWESILDESGDWAARIALVVHSQHRPVEADDAKERPAIFPLEWQLQLELITF